jgi:hypothetical protein
MLKKENKLDKEHKGGVDPAQHYQQASGGNQEQSVSAVPESERVTLKLSSIDSVNKVFAERNEPPYPLSDLSSRSVHREVPQSLEYRAIESESEIQVADLSETDQILIETANSFYNFTITEPKILAGKLIGGVLGNRLVNAALITARFASCTPNYTSQSFKVGSRLIFLIECGNNLRQLTTSVITRLLHRKMQNNCASVNQPEQWQLHETLVTREMEKVER